MSLTRFSLLMPAAWSTQAVIMNKVFKIDISLQVKMELSKATMLTKENVFQLKLSTQTTILLQLTMRMKNRNKSKNLSVKKLKKNQRWKATFKIV